VLIEYADWRWCFRGNVPVAVIAVVAAIPIATGSRASGEARYDTPGAVLITGGLASLVYGSTEVAQSSQENPWANGTAWTFILVGLALIAAFVVLQLRVRNPLLPMRLVLDRNRGGAYLTSTLAGAGLIGAFFLSLYFQQVLGYTPVSAGSPRCPPRWACWPPPARRAPWSPGSGASR
jgi:MFS family permease